MRPERHACSIKRAWKGKSAASEKELKKKRESLECLLKSKEFILGEFSNFHGHKNHLEELIKVQTLNPISRDFSFVVRNQHFKKRLRVRWLGNSTKKSSRIKFVLEKEKW